MRGKRGGRERDEAGASVVRFLPVDVVKRAEARGVTFEIEMVGDEVRVRATIDAETLLVLVRAKC